MPLVVNAQSDEQPRLSLCDTGGKLGCFAAGRKANTGLGHLVPVGGRAPYSGCTAPSCRLHCILSIPDSSPAADALNGFRGATAQQRHLIQVALPQLVPNKVSCTLPASFCLWPCSTPVTVSGPPGRGPPPLAWPQDTPHPLGPLGLECSRCPCHPALLTMSSCL